MKILLISLATTILLLSSCTLQEKMINNIENDFKLLLSSTDDVSVKLLEFPTGNTLNTNVLSQLASKPIATITRIREYRNLLYIFSPESRKMFVITSTNFNLIADITFDSTNIGTDIAFANATDAYIVSPKSNSVLVYDLTVQKVVRTIPVGKNPVSIAVSENQIFVTCADDNSISIIDSRTHKEEAKVSVAPFPYFVSICNEGQTVVVVSLGNGKIDNSQSQSEAVTSFISLETRKVISTTNIAVGSMDPSKQYPTGLAVTSADWIFIPTKESLFRIDAKNKANINLVTRRYYQSINIMPQTQELLFVRNTNNKLELITADGRTGGAKKVYQINNDKLSTILPF